MRAASREALEKLRQHQNPYETTSTESLTALAEDLFATAGLLVDEPVLRRTLADPATSADARAGLVERLLIGRLGEPSLDVVKAAVRERWSSAWDLPDALELTANDSLFAAAENDGILDEVEDELFRFERILDSQSDLAALLDEQTVEATRRVGLLDSVLASKVTPITKLLLDHAVTSAHGRGLSYAVHDLLDAAASRRHRSVARVLSAVELTDDQQQRLAAALGQLYGRPITVRAAVDPSVRGGLVVRVGDEVIDGSVASRLTTIRAGLTV